MSILKSNIQDSESEGIKEMREAIQEYLQSGEGTKAVREYLGKAKDDNDILLKYLRGRKYRPNHAWETLKSYAEVRFDTYPEVYLSACPKEVKELINEHAVGILKGYDKNDRLVAYFDASKWDTEKYSFELLTAVAIHIAEQLMANEDCIKNGFIFVQECSGMSMKHAKEYTLSNMLRFMNVFWYASPLKPKAVIFTNVPFFLTFIYGIIKPFLPKKLKDRFSVTSTNRKFQPVYEHCSPDILPTCLGGTLEPEEANNLELTNVFL